MKKALVAILLVASMILVLYPSVDALVKAQDAINKLNYAYSIGRGAYNDTFDGARNSLVMQIAGFVLLYMFLGLGLFYYGKTADQQVMPIRQEAKPVIEQAMKSPVVPKTPKVLTRRVKIGICLLSVVTFIPVFILLITPLVPYTIVLGDINQFMNTSAFYETKDWLPLYFLERGIETTLVSLSAGLAGYFVAKRR